MFFSNFLNVIIALTIVSPIWPLGENPLVGDPFIIVNKARNELAYIEDGKIFGIYKVSTGVSKELTPEGKFTIVVKAKDPYYRKKDIPGGSLKNPLGSRWIGFNAKDTDGRIYGIHGNNNPSVIGQNVTQGCVRMYEKDVQLLFDHIPIGTKILIINSSSSFKEIGKANGALPK